MLDWLSGNAISQALHPPSRPSEMPGLVRTVVLAVLQAVVLAPLLVAIVLRLLGHDAPRSPPAPILLLRFAAWSFLVGMTLTVRLLPRFFTTSPAPDIVCGPAQIVGSFVHVRLPPLLPAVAPRGPATACRRKLAAHQESLLVAAGRLGHRGRSFWLPGPALCGLRFQRHVPPTASATLDVAGEALGVLGVVLVAAFAAQVFTDLPRRPEPVADHAS